MGDRVTAGRRMALSACALVAALTAPALATGAQRTVLGEDFNTLT